MHAPFRPMNVTIPTDGCGVLHVSQVQSINLVAYFIDEEKDSSLQFGKVFLSLVFINTSIHQRFPYQIPEFTNLPKSAGQIYSIH